MSTTSATGKFVNLHNYQEQSKEKYKSQSSVARADSNSSVPNNSTNSIDHTRYYTAKHDSPIHPSTSGEVYDRHQILKSIYSAKRSAPATSTKYRLAVKPSSFPLLPIKLLDKRPLRVSSQFDQGRTPQGELIDNLREELYGIKRNYAAMLKENVILKTRLKRSNNETARKDRQLQNLLFIQSKGYAFDDQRGNILAMQQKIVMLESLLKEKTNEISRLKSDREAMRISNYQEHIAGLQAECKHLQHCLTYVTPPLSKIRTGVHILPKRQRTAYESNNARKLRETISFLEKENNKMRLKLQMFFNCSSASPNGRFDLQI
uniref:Lebercilin domain-containing protein n=1 Tax=Elaeophora elaphi TaxID=1147741 RepID=A0A0R3RUZ2_9BILA